MVNQSYKYQKRPGKDDPFSDIPVIPGVKKYKNPSIEKFLAGKTSIFSIAKSIDEEQQALNVQKEREMSSSHWGLGDRLEQVKIRNKRSKGKAYCSKSSSNKIENQQGRCCTFNENGLYCFSV